ncbi:MAG TPA: arginine--tRNA ligase [Thermoanaerobaculia bacterium]|nr:arginine--tRNA ligase [Thermoanaerobaculia bacterium]
MSTDWTRLKNGLAGEIARLIGVRFGIEHRPVLEVPPRRELGDLASPAAMQLARLLRRSPRAIADELRDALRRELPAAVRAVEVQGAGYLNLFLDRRALAAALLAAPAGGETRPARPGKLVIEHTNINPNKAAHIGHLRNAVLGDVLARCARSLGLAVEVQNYIDDTGVQLADVVVGFIDLRGATLAEVEASPEPFDFLCWDLYSQVGRWYQDDPERQRLRRETLHQLETGRGERAEMGRVVARRVVARHLATMRRLGIAYDLLTHECDILHLDFFASAFARLKESGAIHLEKEGKNAGCWVMPLSRSEEFAGLEDPDKVIVRSDGTVTYVGKDIAYQLWKFGLLGRDFGYCFWPQEKVWETCQNGAGEHPRFGGAHRVINVIDARQSYLQKIVRAGLEALGHTAEAERSIHFAYEMVALSPATARLLGYLPAPDADNADSANSDDSDGAAADSESAGDLPGGAGGRPAKTLEMSGRKGIGVKADDLLDQLEAKSREEVARRNRALPDGELEALAHEIAAAALRFFMVKATTHRIIAFDFDEALNFEGESGPYLQYSLVRAKNIGRRLAEEGLAPSVGPAEIEALEHERFGDDSWDLILAVAQIGELVEKATESLELSLVARHALEIAQRFNAFYHRHPILQEKDPRVRAARLATMQVFRRGLESLGELLGISWPERM